MSKYIGLYADKELQTPISQKRVGDRWVWFIDFDTFEVGEEQSYRLFLENQSKGNIEDLEISVTEVNRKGIDVTLYDNKVSSLGFGKVHEFYIKWDVSSSAKAGKCQVNLTIKGTITEE